MNSPLYAVAQHFAQGGYADGGAVDETYVNGQLVPGGVQAGYSVAGTTRPRQKDYSQYGDRASAMQMLDQLAMQKAANRLQRSGAGSRAAAARFVRQFGQNPPPRNTYIPPPPVVIQRDQQSSMNAGYQSMPSQVNQPNSMPAVDTSYGGGVPLPRNMGWYGQPVAAPAAPQAYAQGGMVSSGSDIMDALASMGYNPYGG